MNAGGFGWLAALLVALVPLLWPGFRAGPRAGGGMRPRSHAVASSGSRSRALVEAAPAPSGDRTPRAAAAQPEDLLSVAGALDLIALALGSGVPLVTAVEVVAERCGPVVGGQLSQVVAALRWGVEEGKAWDGLPACWRPAGQALALAGMAGVPPAGLLRRAAADLRRSEQRRIEEAAGRLSVLVVVPLGLCFLPAFALLTVVPVIAVLAGDLLAGAR
ncbi:type II secretion system F family protein [Flexivirga sp. ID2601S]|uniref:Type II secretion system F family protein n=1 Tax=Flexivirga aerilata TaxID=1656889 RepID=A0A849AEM4_9MICO|nr:type II secretion system F family protein [Flexivirga aerilata]NNG38026.1 type II secretion system F family protein [Flexivirga aerilata]